MKRKIALRKYPFHFQNIDHGTMGYGPTFLSEVLIGAFALKTRTMTVSANNRNMWKLDHECQRPDLK